MLPSTERPCAIASRSGFGMRCAFPPETNATRARASTRTSSPRLHCCNSVIEAPFTSCGVNEQPIIYLCPSIASRSAFGMRCAFPAEINATRTRAVTRRSSARLHSCSKVTDAPLTSCGSVTTSSTSSKTAGFRKSIVIERTTKVKPGASFRASWSSAC
jgi:hypothetical protein